VCSERNHSVLNNDITVGSNAPDCVLCLNASNTFSVEIGPWPDPQDVKNTDNLARLGQKFAALRIG